MKDERIQTTVSHFAAIGFWIYYVLMLISLNYRSLILKQHPQEIWDILAIFCISTIFVFIAFANKGVFDHKFKRMFLTIFILLVIGLPALFFIQDKIHSILDVVVCMISSLFGGGIAIAIAHFLNRRWKRKAGIEEEK